MTIIFKFLIISVLIIFILKAALHAPFRNWLLQPFRQWIGLDDSRKPKL